MCELMCPEIYNIDLIAGPELHALFFPTFEIETIGIDPEASIPGVSGPLPTAWQLFRPMKYGRNPLKSLICTVELVEWTVCSGADKVFKAQALATLGILHSFNTLVLRRCKNLIPYMTWKTMWNPLQM